MRSYRIISLILCILFFIVGFIFLAAPNGVLRFFNSLSGPLHFPESDMTGYHLYPVLAVGYMYIAGLMAFFMFKNPENRLAPLLLAHGKFASSLVSFLFIFLHGAFLILIVNGLIDFIIGLTVLILRKKSEA